MDTHAWRQNRDFRRGEFGDLEMIGRRLFFSPNAGISMRTCPLVAKGGRSNWPLRLTQSKISLGAPSSLLGCRHTRRGPALGALCLSAFLAFTCASGASAAVSRLSVSGTQILDPSGAPILLRGYNWNEYAQQPDAAQNFAQGANVVRMTLGWHIDGSKNCGSSFPNSKFDAYAPGRPGNVDPRLLADLDTKIAWATSRDLWVDLAIRGGDCDFWTSPTVGSQFIDMWGFLANHYKTMPYIGMYELLSEPKPTNDRVNNEIVKSLYEKVISRIKLADPATPIMVGPAPSYNIRNMDQIYIPAGRNIIYAANFYEPKDYVKQLKNGSLLYTGFPGKYDDAHTDKTTCQYNGKGGTQVYVDKTWLSGLIRCLTNFRTAHRAPTFVEQIGIRSGTPGSERWAKEALELLNANKVGWAYWVYRKEYTNSGKGLLANDIGVVWQDAGGSWRIKPDWLDLISAEMGGPRSAQ